MTDLFLVLFQPFFSEFLLPVGAVAWLQLREFSDKMTVWAPEQMYRLGFRHCPKYIKDREAIQGMSYDEEVRTSSLANFDLR